MNSFFITLINKQQLTHDVYELIYRCKDAITIEPGQFLLCDTDSAQPRLRRSYSVSDYDSEGNIHFIIKEVTNGTGGSKAICQQNIGTHMQVWGPTGKFVLPHNTAQKIIFIGTGTGFAPLYFQAKNQLHNNFMSEIHFIFGVREEKDIFYQDIFQTWSQYYPHFRYDLCVSQGIGEGYYPGRVTSFLEHNSTIIDASALYSICGSPAMVREVRDILSVSGIQKENIFFEQY